MSAVECVLIFAVVILEAVIYIAVYHNRVG